MDVRASPAEQGSSQGRGGWFSSPLLAFGLLFSPEAFAYLDPGTGSILLQGLIAAVAAAITWASLYWRRTKAWFRSLLGRGGDDSDGQAPR